MARTLSDTLIVAVLEAATRLTGARGPIAGSAAANAANAAGGGAAAAPPAGTTGDAPTGGATSTDAPAAPAAPAGRNGAAGGGETDSRTAEQIAADFRTIYGQIEDLVRGSAEQETKTVGFGRG